MYLTVILSLMSGFLPHAIAQNASFNGTVLTLSEVTVDSLTYNVTLQINGSNPNQVVLTAAEIVDNPVLTTPATYSAGTLVVPSVDVFGTLYWGRFNLVDDDPVTFELAVAELDDEDDDNDGIPDDQDSNPYFADTSTDPLNINGSWLLIFTVTAVDGLACFGEEGSKRQEFVDFFYDDLLGNYRVTGDVEYGDIAIIGNELRYYGEFEEDDGLTKSTIVLTVNSAGSAMPTLSGLETWQWGTVNSNDEFILQCDNGRSNVEVFFQAPL